MNIMIDNTKYKILTYFDYNTTAINSKEHVKKYVMYTIPQDTKTRKVFLSKVIEDKKHIYFIEPNETELKALHKLIKTMLNNDMSLQLFLKNKYEYIEISKLKEKSIILDSNKKIELLDTQYISLISNKYLTYPKLEILNIDEIMKEGYDKNDPEAITASILFLIIYFIGILIYQIVLWFNNVKISSLLQVNGPSIVIWSLIVALISMIAFNFEETEPKSTFKITLLLILIFSILLGLVMAKLTIIKTIILSVMYTVIFTIPYTICKKLSFSIVNKIKARNYLTYYCLFLIPFTIIFFVILKIYMLGIVDIIEKITI